MARDAQSKRNEEARLAARAKKNHPITTALLAGQRNVALDLAGRHRDSERLMMITAVTEDVLEDEKFAQGRDGPVLGVGVADSAAGLDPAPTGPHQHGGMGSAIAAWSPVTLPADYSAGQLVARVSQQLPALMGNSSRLQPRSLVVADSLPRPAPANTKVPLFQSQARASSSNLLRAAARGDGGESTGGVGGDGTGGVGGGDEGAGTGGGGGGGGGIIAGRDRMNLRVARATESTEKTHHSSNSKGVNKGRGARDGKEVFKNSATIVAERDGLQHLERELSPFSPPADPGPASGFGAVDTPAIAPFNGISLRPVKAGAPFLFPVHVLREADHRKQLAKTGASLQQKRAASALAIRSSAMEPSAGTLPSSGGIRLAPLSKSDLRPRPWSAVVRREVAPDTSARTHSTFSVPTPRPLRDPGEPPRTLPGNIAPESLANRSRRAFVEAKVELALKLTESLEVRRKF